MPIFVPRKAHETRSFASSSSALFRSLEEEEFGALHSCAKVEEKEISCSKRSICCSIVGGKNRITILFYYRKLSSDQIKNAVSHAIPLDRIWHLLHILLH